LFLNTLIVYYLSADAGLHWELVDPGVKHIFVNSGSQLCWRAVLSTTESIRSPSLSSLSIIYNVKLDAPELTSPSDGIHIGDNTPLLQWTDAYVDVGYLVQLDTVASFDSIDLTNVTVPVGRKNCTTPALADGLWYWRVAANDSQGDLGFFSMTRSIIIDTSLPTWDETPINRVVEIGMPVRYDLNASDPSGIDKWWLNDTVHFAIDNSGIITNTTFIAVNTINIQVWVNDTCNNIQTATFSVTVQDTVSPYWLVEPTDVILDYDEPLDYQIQVSDISGIDHYEINETSYFSVDSTGRIANATTLEPGIYGLLITVYDPYGNYISSEFSISVLEQPTEPPDLIPLVLVLGGLGGVILIVILVVFMKRRPAI
jgi:hypothetical protein